MLSEERVLEILDAWNLWEKDIDFGVRRERYLEKLSPLLQRKEVLVLKGIRRCGKSTIMKQLMRLLLEKGIKKQQLLYVNLEDYGFKDYMELELFERILQAHKKKFSTTSRTYFFIDEIQLMSDWERFVRTKYDQDEDIKFIVSGSNASLLAQELSTKLTGRNITVQIHPLNFKEFKEFKTKASLEEYLIYGGFPEVVLEEDKSTKKILLQQYYEDIISKEILTRHTVRNTEVVFELCRYLMHNSGTRQSMNKLAKAFGINDETVKEYISYMIDAYLLVKVPFFSFSLKKRHNKLTQPKYYASDNGFLHIADLRYTKNQGNIFENACLVQLKQKEEDVAYWLEKGEVDFILGHSAINVTIGGKSIPQREFEGLSDFKRKHKGFQSMIVTMKEKKKEVNDESWVTSFEEFFLDD